MRSVAARDQCAGRIRFGRSPLFFSPARNAFGCYCSTTLFLACAKPAGARGRRRAPRWPIALSADRVDCYVPPRSLCTSVTGRFVAAQLIASMLQAASLDFRAGALGSRAPERYPLKLTHRRNDSSPIHPLFMPSQKTGGSVRRRCSDRVRYRKAPRRTRSGHTTTRLRTPNVHAAAPHPELLLDIRNRAVTRRF